MTSSVFGRLVVGIPYTDKSGRQGKRWKNVGVMLKHEGNDASKGPGFQVLLDRDFNPAGVEAVNPASNVVAISVFWPDAENQAPSPRHHPPPGKSIDSGLMDDDIPF